MDPSWWELREAESRFISACNRKPPKYWDAMQRLYGWCDVSTEHMYDADGARRELEDDYERADESSDSGHGGRDDDGNYEAPTNEYIPQTQEENTHLPDTSFIDPEETYGDIPDEAVDETNREEMTQQIHGRSGRHATRATPYNVGRGRSSPRRSNSRLRSASNKSRSNRRRREFEGSVTTAFQDMADARRATVSALRPDGFSQEEYGKFKEAFSMLNALPIEKYKTFWKASVELLKKDAWWRNTFVDTPFQSDDDRIGFLESITGVDRVGTRTGEAYENFQPFLSGSSGGSVRSSGSSVGYSSGNSQYNQHDTPQFHPSAAMGQFFPSQGLGVNMPGQMMGAPYYQMMFPQGLGSFPYMPPSPAAQMMQTPAPSTVFNAGTSSMLSGTPPRQMGNANRDPRSNVSPGFGTPSRRTTDIGYRFGEPSEFGARARHLNFSDDGTENQQNNNPRQ